MGQHRLALATSSHPRAEQNVRAVFHQRNQPDLRESAFAAAGAGTTIDSVLEIGGSGTMGVILDLRSMQTSGYADNLMTLVRGGPQDATAQTHFGIYVGDSATRSVIAAETPATSQGSLYINTTGELFICVTQPGSGADQWEKVTTTAAD